MEETDPITRELHEAEETLQETIEQACAVDVLHARTGELIRVEEMLSIAGEAAKKVISIRRKRREEQRAEDDQAETVAGDGVPRRRTFTDPGGVEWTVRAVHPNGILTNGRRHLPVVFQRGWLAFECDGAKRRLSPIPEGWDELEDDALSALCAEATPAPALRQD